MVNREEWLQMTLNTLSFGIKNYHNFKYLNYILDNINKNTFNYIIVYLTKDNLY